MRLSYRRDWTVTTHSYRCSVQCFASKVNLTSVLTRSTRPLNWPRSSTGQWLKIGLRKAQISLGQRGPLTEWRGGVRRLRVLGGKCRYQQSSRCSCVASGGKSGAARRRIFPNAPNRQGFEISRTFWFVSASSEGWCVQQGSNLPGQKSVARSSDGRVEGNRDSEAHRRGLPRGDHELPGRNESEREVASKTNEPGSRTRKRSAKAARGAEI